MQTQPGLAYFLGSTLYVGLTNRACGLSLPASRGPGFLMPASSGFAPLAREPSADEVVAVVTTAFASDPRKASQDGGAPDPGVVFAGLGDPLLRLPTLVAAATRIRDRIPGVRLRVSTNGLTAPGRAEEVARELLAAGVGSATVALNAGDAGSYRCRMLTPPDFPPPYFADAATAVGQPAPGAGFDDVCALITAMAREGLDVTATCVGREGVDVQAVRSMALGLGAKHFTERSFHW